MLKIYNTFSQQKELFQPWQANRVSLYVCGVTVYDKCHLGHARTFVVFDTVVRYLRSQGYQVTYVRNVTDIDNKIIQRAADNHESWQQLSQRMLHAMQQDFTQLNLLPPDYEPLATASIAPMITLIQCLLDRGHAYIGKSGDLLFAVNSYPEYGQLSHQPLSQLQVGSRIAVDPQKHNPLDFVLWKIAKEGEPSWPSPWGLGRPGWHIECSAMCHQHLGEQVDLHGGGTDLLFPHHENERAQTCCSYGPPFVRYWMHTGLVMLKNQKMAKSLGNTLLLSDLLKQYDAETLRYFLLSSHYRSPLCYTAESLPQAQQALERLYIALQGCDPLSTTDPCAVEETQNLYLEQFQAALNDDFNLPQAYAVLFDVAHQINRFKKENDKAAQPLAIQLRHMGRILGLLQQDPTHFLQQQRNREEKIDILFIERLIAQRNQARQKGDWVTADTVRTRLNHLGIVLQDTPNGTQWKQSSRK